MAAPTTQEARTRRPAARPRPSHHPHVLPHPTQRLADPAPGQPTSEHGPGVPTRKAQPGGGQTLATRLAWEAEHPDGTPTRRVWLQTSSRDHPHAKPNYERRGSGHSEPSNGE